MIKIYGLVGKNISYSFSNSFFKRKFKKENIKNTIYNIFDIKKLSLINEIIKVNKNFLGFNVTIPYKKKIISKINIINNNLKKIGSINTVKIINDITIGYNTDIYGFENSFKLKLKSYHNNALILGNGGVSKSIIYVLTKLGIKYLVVSRNKKNGISYSNISKEIINNNNIIINCTPLGTYPNINECPNIPYEFLSKKHYLYDLVYNPKETLFLKKGKNIGCIVQNGLNMLYLQANLSWKIWNEINFDILY
ncbi:shikimate dehydrogenase family protein [Candidatus Karelsulcia muelleri]|uniref:Shikimate 5-dehydrogenase n=1 Tax=Candidatus Karelsulcia muelleri PSPU TaxID=1189303 RepID=A0AAD1AYM2_9FLAO|nr:shikimate dehydrogenase [Candidatus Karelsulcia muelleri]NJJ98692.1 shikimate dehydrogenase [Candidatus Karelsulcia muelleri]BAO66345.1 shikimate 5-dehydrogenase [Candidatus Karelsulcia muelleri PSPU]